MYTYYRETFFQQRPGATITDSGVSFAALLEPSLLVPVTASSGHFQRVINQSMGD